MLPITPFKYYEGILLKKLLIGGHISSINLKTNYSSLHEIKLDI